MCERKPNVTKLLLYQLLGSWLHLKSIYLPNLGAKDSAIHDTVALVAALLLSLQVSVWFLIPEFQWEWFEEEWGGGAQKLRDAFIFFWGVSICFTTFGLYISLFNKLALHQCNGPEEERSLLTKLRSLGSVGYSSTMKGLLLTLMLSVIFGVLFCSTLTGKLAVAIVLLLFQLVGGVMGVKILSCLLEVKASKETSPIAVSMEELVRDVELYIHSNSIEDLSEQSFNEWYLERYYKEHSVHTSLSALTSKRLDAVIKHFHETVIQKEKLQCFGQQTDI